MPSIRRNTRALEGDERWIEQVELHATNTAMFHCIGWPSYCEAIRILIRLVTRHSLTQRLINMSSFPP